MSTAGFWISEGREYERLEADLAAVARRTGIRVGRLAVRSTMSGWEAEPAREAALRRRRGDDLTAGNRALLRSRYAADVALFGYR